MIASIFSRVSGEMGILNGKRLSRQAQTQRRQLVAKLTRQFLAALETPLRARMRDLIERGRATDATSTRRGRLPQRGSAGTASPQPRRRMRKPRRNLHTPPPLDPEQIKRDAEFARLRALLKPTSQEPPPPPQPLPLQMEQPHRPTSPGEFLHALE